MYPILLWNLLPNYLLEYQWPSRIRLMIRLDRSEDDSDDTNTLWSDDGPAVVSVDARAKWRQQE